MSKNKIVSLSSSALGKMIVETHEETQKEITADYLGEQSKEYRQTTSLLLQREGVEIGLQQVNDILDGISKWINEGWNEFPNAAKVSITQAIETQARLLYGYLKPYMKKRLKKMTIDDGKTPYVTIVKTRYLLKKFAEETKRDEFFNCELSPFIFLRQLSKLSTLSALMTQQAISDNKSLIKRMQLKEPKPLVRYRDYVTEDSKKLAWIERQNNKAYQEKIAKEGAEIASK